jgi:Asp-tRNA(Asn)/Glu-tRNA(Gln) amidotransferase A subunit family amidase
MWFWSTGSPSWQAVSSQKCSEREKAIASAPQVEVAHHVYLRATASEIVDHIAKGEWTASEVVEAYIAAAAFAHAATNCVTEVLFKDARREASELDREFAQTGVLKGPLHGVPVSFKDQYDIAGVDSTIGFTRWANKPSTEDAHLVAQFRAAGAIIIVKTNVPQTMFAFECSNPLWGRTTNPSNKLYTCGGSSGGEGALLAMDGSVIGLGSDIGGSLRIPAAYCGIYSLKPTVGRICTLGTRAAVKGFEGIKSVMGPMSRSVGDLELVCRTVFGVQGSDLATPPAPYRDVQLSPKLRFGYYKSDSYVKASPACVRAVLETVEALRKEGHECIEFELPNAARAFELFAALTSSDGYKSLVSHLGPDPKEKSLFLVTLGPKLNGFLRAIAGWVFETLMGDKHFANALRQVRVKSVNEFWKLTAERDDYILAWHKEVWEKHKFDGIIAPVQALPQLLHGGCSNLSSLSCSTILYNVVDSPVGCIPVTRVDPMKDQLTDEWKNGPGFGSIMVEKAVYAKDGYYDTEKMKGMPVGVQIIGKKWDDEKVLAMMHVVDQALGKERGFGPGKWHEGDNKSATV